jgi:predicted DNA-binding transcriptional regulator AlpA
MRRLSTVQVAKQLGLQQSNLQRAIAQGKVQAPPLVSVGPVKVRLWSSKDVERARKSLKRKKA